jgi:hypothetical protein
MDLEHRGEAEPGPADAETIGWFAARQPAVVRFLEELLWRPDGDAFAVGLDAACRLFRVCAAMEGAPPPRLGRAALARGLAAMAEGVSGSQRVRAHKAWIEGHLDDPPIPLTRRELAEVTLGLHALAYAIDAMLGDSDDDDAILY